MYDSYFKYIFNNIVVASTESVRSKSIKSSFSYVIYMYRNKRFIIEMNNSYTSEIVYKNHFYLFYHHIFDLENKNSYNSNIETYLIDIDNFDILDKLHKKDMKHEFIYQSRLILDNTLYSLYPNIRAVRINLDYLKKKQYAYGMLSDIERQGEEDGIEKGSANEKISIAKILRKKNFTDKDIMEITGITKSQIKTI